MPSGPKIGEFQELVNERPSRRSMDRRQGRRRQVVNSVSNERRIGFDRRTLLERRAELTHELSAKAREPVLPPGAPDSY